MKWINKDVDYTPDRFDIYRHNLDVRLVFKDLGLGESAMRIDLALKQIVVNTRHPHIQKLAPDLLNLILYHEINHFYVNPRNSNTVQRDYAEIGNEMSREEAWFWLNVVYNWDTNTYGLLTKERYGELLMETARIDREDEDVSEEWDDLISLAYDPDPISDRALKARKILLSNLSNAQRALSIADLFIEERDPDEGEQMVLEIISDSSETGNDKTRPSDEFSEDQQDSAEDDESSSESDNESDADPEDAEESDEKLNGEYEDDEESNRESKSQKQDSDDEELDSEDSESTKKPSPKKKRKIPPAILVNTIPGDKGGTYRDVNTDPLPLDKGQNDLDNVLTSEEFGLAAGKEAGRLEEASVEETLLVDLKHIMDVFRSAFDLGGFQKTEESDSGFMIGSRPVRSYAEIARPASARDVIMMDYLPPDRMYTRRCGVTKRGTGLKRITIYQDVSGSIMWGPVDERGNSDTFKQVVGVCTGIISEIKRNNGEVAHALFSYAVQMPIAHTKDYRKVFLNTMHKISGGTSFNNVLTHAMDIFNLEDEDVVIVTDGQDSLDSNIKRKWKESGNRLIIAIAGNPGYYSCRDLKDFVDETGGAMIFYDSSQQNCKIVHDIGEIFDQTGEHNG